MSRLLPFAALLTLWAVPAASAADLPRSLGGITLGDSLAVARAAAAEAGRGFTGCDTLRAEADGRPLLTLCSHQGEARGTEIAIGRTDLQVWADGEERVFAVVTAAPLSCRPEEQMAAVRGVTLTWGDVTAWQPPWSWRGEDGRTSVLVDVLNAESPCGLITELRDAARHGAVAADLADALPQ